MNLLTIIGIAIGLAMDCFAVSLARGLSGHATYAQVGLMALMFGLFQGAMPIIGYAAGTFFADFFSRYAPWIALLLLGAIGGKMIWESVQDKEAEKQSVLTEWSIWTLLAMAIATSIDALATGVIFIPFPHSLWLAIFVIALVSFLFSGVGWWIGTHVGTRFRMNAGLIGGLILIGIGIKICIEGVCF